MKILTFLFVAIASLSQTPQSTNLGLIGYFNGGCPDGWTQYENLAGRVPVGSGGGYPLGTTGGENTHTLSISEMPNHNHNNGEFKYLSRFTGQNTAGSIDHYSAAGHREPDLVFTEEILSSGGSQPHNNMQSYLVLTPCKKTTDDVSEDTFIAFRDKVEEFMSRTSAPTIEPTINPTPSPTREPTRIIRMVRRKNGISWWSRRARYSYASSSWSSKSSSSSSSKSSSSSSSSS